MREGTSIMEYRKLVPLIPAEKWDAFVDTLLDFILTSKNDEKMPSQLANTLLHSWQQSNLKNEVGLTALLQAALLLEPEKTINAFIELEMDDLAKRIRELQAS